MLDVGAELRGGINSGVTQCPGLRVRRPESKVTELDRWEAVLLGEGCSACL